MVPDGYIGWLVLECDVKNAASVPTENGIKVFRFPANGALATSSSGPERGAENEYFFVSPEGSLRRIPTEYRDGKGMVWGQYEGTANGTLSQFGFFVGTEDQYKKFQMHKTRPGPVLVP
jgi:hypothetical protein